MSAASPAAPAPRAVASRARVYADVNASRPSDYSDYDILDVDWQ